LDVIRVAKWGSSSMCMVCLPFPLPNPLLTCPKKVSSFFASFPFSHHLSFLTLSKFIY
jgi:hypothetical protein